MQIHYCNVYQNTYNTAQSCSCSLYFINIRYIETILQIHFVVDINDISILCYVPVSYTMNQDRLWVSYEVVILDQY